MLENSDLPCVKFGGYPTAERIVAAFGDHSDTADFPVALLQISPVSEKFSDNLTHRDFSGWTYEFGH